MSIIAIHSWLSDVVVLYAALMGLWGLLNFAQRQGISEGYWWGLVIGELLILTQGSLGGLLWFQGRQPEQGIHLFFGVVAAVGIPAVYVSTRGREGRRESLAYGIAARSWSWSKVPHYGGLVVASGNQYSAVLRKG